MPKTDRPNILYIFTDQQSYDAMSCAGNDNVATPNMDRLASEGVRFERAYTAYPLCTPARAAMFTGRFPHEVGITTNGQPIAESFRASEMGNVFSRAGYHCAYGGKWHVPQISITDDHGFRSICPFDDTHLAERAIGFMKEERDNPFLLVLSFDNPHNICEWGRQQPLPWGQVTIPPLEECPGLPANHAPAPFEPEAIRACLHLEEMSRYIIDYSSDDWRRRRAAYYRLVEKVDIEVGRLLDALDDLSLSGNTLVIFSSDHGDMNSAHQLIQKCHFYEEASRVPLIVAGPGVAHGGVEGGLIHASLDLYPTFCDFAGVSTPEGLRGTSLRRLLAGERPPEWRTHLVAESGIEDHGCTLRMVRTERYKYVVYQWGRWREQLYDMENDPGEMVNLAVESRFADLLQEHRRLLRDWCRETGDSFGKHYSHPEAPFNVPGFEFDV